MTMIIISNIVNRRKEKWWLLFVIWSSTVWRYRNFIIIIIIIITITFYCCYYYARQVKSASCTLHSLLKAYSLTGLLPMPTDPCEYPSINLRRCITFHIHANSVSIAHPCAEHGRAVSEFHSIVSCSRWCLSRDRPRARKELVCYLATSGVTCT